MTHRIVSYLSDEQYEIFAKLLKDCGSDEAGIIRIALRSYMATVGKAAYGEYFKWPDNDPQRGGKRNGAGWKKGIPRKIGG